MKSYVVIGLGRFGSALARQLSKQGAEILAVDYHQDMVRKIADEVTQAVEADATDLEVLRALGVAGFDCAVVAIGEDLAVSVLTVMNLKELKVPYIICKAQDETYKRVLEKLGVDLVIIPEKEYAHRLADKLNHFDMLEYIELTDDYGILKLPAPLPWQGKTLRELDLRARLGLTVISVKNDEKLRMSPPADYRVQSGDVLALLGSADMLERAEKL